MQDPNFISLFVAPLERAGIIEQQELDQTFLQHHLTALNLTAQYQAALALTNKS
jgi:hypothetical protein